MFESSSIMWQSASVNQKLPYFEVPLARASLAFYIQNPCPSVCFFIVWTNNIRRSKLKCWVILLSFVVLNPVCLWSVIYKTQFATSQKLVTLDFHINVLLELLKYKWIAHLPYKLKLLGWIGWCMQLNMVSERSWVRILFHVQAFFSNMQESWASLNLRRRIVQSQNTTPHLGLEWGSWTKV